MSIFEARNNLPEDIKGSLAQLHEKMKLRSLWADAQSNYSASHDIGHDMFMQRIDPSKSQYVASFDEKAQASALQLRIAQVIGLVNADPKGYEFMIQELSPEVHPYWGLNQARDSGKGMAFGSGTPGRFESGISRRVVVQPEHLIDTLSSSANELLDSNQAEQLKTWWQNQFPKAPEQNFY